MSESAKQPVSFPIKQPGPPKVWKVVEMKKKDTGKVIKFSIQEIPEDRYAEVVEHMITYFIADEPMCNSLNGKDDSEYIDSFRYLWLECLQEGLSVGAFTENPEGGKPILAGANVLTLHFKGSDDFDMTTLKSKKAQRVGKAIVDLMKVANTYEKYGVDRYMGAFGLSVDPSFRGASLGGHLLNARTDIGVEYKIPVTVTAFTSPISQKLAERCGFETLIERSYSSFRENGGPFFPGTDALTVKVMGKRLY